MFVTHIPASSTAVAPVDPFTGKPLEYRREGDGFLIYSAGPDGRDDGGSRDGSADLVIRVSK